MPGVNRSVLQGERVVPAAQAPVRKAAGTFTAADDACTFGGLSARPGEGGLKTTRYFEEQVLRKRPYIRRDWCREVLAAPLRRETQDDGRIRFWGRVIDVPEVPPRVLRVVTLADGETVHNAFFDRNFREDEP